MQFSLVSKFKPTGDQPRAIEALIDGIKSKNQFQTLLGVTGSGKTFTMANVIAKINKPTLILAHNKTLAAQLASEFREFFPENAVEYFVSYYDYYQPESYIPSKDLYIAKESDINEEIERLRHKATVSLLTRKDVIIVASISCIYGLGNKAEYASEKIELKKGDKLTTKELIKKLVSIQYQRNDIDFHRGTFRVKGDTIDIFPSFEDETITKVEFFGNNIEKITEVNAITGNKKKELASALIFPNTHYVTPREEIERVSAEIKNELTIQSKKFEQDDKLVEAQRIRQRTEFDLEMLKETGVVSGIENYSRYMDGRSPGEPPNTLMDYFPKDFLMFIDESHMSIPQSGGMYEGDRSRKTILIENGFRLPSALDNRPLNFKEFESKLPYTIFVSATPKEYEIKKSKGHIAEQLIRPTGLLDPKIEIKKTENQIENLISEIRKITDKKQRVLITTLTKRMAEDLAKYLKEQKIKVAYLHADIDTMERLEILRDLRLGKYDVLVGINLLREGLDLPEVSLVAILDADKEGYLRSDVSLIQTMGRAARHSDGKVIMYADQITGSMKRAINETSRRRKIQEEYNKKNGITPKSIMKKISETRLGGNKKEKASEQNQSWTKPINKSAKEMLIKELKSKMQIASQNLEFEKAAYFRDEINKLKTHK